MGDIISINTPVGEVGEIGGENSTIVMENSPIYGYNQQ